MKYAQYILICFLALSMQLFAEVIPYDSQLVDKVDITITNDPSSNGEGIRSRLKTKEGKIFSQTDFDADLKLLAKDYDHIEPCVESVNNHIHVSLKVWPKPRIHSILWEGNKQMDSEALNKELKISKGALFDKQEFNKAFHAVKSHYVKSGYFEAEMAYRLEDIPDSNEVDIVICVEEGRAGMIECIRFEGFTCEEEHTLSELIVTKKYNIFLSWLMGTGTYNEDMIQHDKYQVLNYVQNEGYADAVVNIRVEEAEKDHRIIIIISVDKGEYYTFGDITFEGNSLYPDETIKKLIHIRRGQAFSPEQIHETIRKIMNYYGRYGYIEAVVNYEPKRKGTELVYSVHLTITEGEQYRVGLIKVFGNNITQTKVILHETLVMPGEVFNSNKLKLTEQRLQNVGYFKNVNVYAVRTEGTSVLPGNYRDVHIEVEETGTGNIGAFVGFSTAENIFGGVNLTEKNFNIAGLGRAGRDGLGALRGGGEYAHITATFGQTNKSYVLSWTKPYFLDTPWSVGFEANISQNEYISSHYDIKSQGITFHGTYPWNAFVRIGVHYRLSDTQIHIDESKFEPEEYLGDSKDDDAKDEFDRIEKNKAYVLNKLKHQARNAGVISAVGSSIIYDATDHPMKPSSGLKSKMEVEFAGLGGKHHFFAFAYLNTWYYDIYGKATLKLRGDARFLFPVFGGGPLDLPLDERFFIGGDSQIRGFTPYRLGPTIPWCLEDPLGGVSMQLLSAEIYRPIISRVEGFIFVDAGNVSEHRGNFDILACSTGFGCRIQIMDNGPPLTVGMGFPIGSYRSTDIKKFFINIGGKF